MEINKAIAKHSHSFIGGNPKVFCYKSDDNSKKIDIMTCTASPYSDIDIHATIGLAEHDLGLFHGPKKLRIELMAIGPIGDEDWANIIASASFEVMDMQECGYGTVISNVVGEYKKSTALHHVVLLSPNYWASYTPLETEDMIIAWLFAIPISDNEREYILKNGAEEFEKLLSKQDVDILDLARLSFV